jgi:hypothetical protein
VIQLLSRYDVQSCMETIILDDNLTVPTQVIHENMIEQVLLTWDNRCESIENMANIVREQWMHPNREEFRHILEYYR